MLHQSFRSAWLILRPFLSLSQLAGLMVLMVGSSLLEGAGILLLAPILHVMQDPSAPMPGQSGPMGAVLAWLAGRVSLGGLLLAFLALVGLRGLLTYHAALGKSRIQMELVDTLRQRCFESLMGAEWRWIVGGRRAHHANLLLSDINRVGTLFVYSLSLLSLLVTMTVFLAAALALSWKMALLAAVLGVIVFLVLSGHRTQAFDLGRDLTKVSRGVHASVEESLAGLKLAKILGSEGRHAAQFLDAAASLRDRRQQFTASTTRAQTLYSFGGAVIVAGYLYAGLTWWGLPLAELLVLVMLLARLVPLFTSGQQHLHHWLNALPALEEVKELLRQSAQAAEPRADGPPTPWPVRESIELEGVTLAYQDRESPALDGIHLRFPARTTTAVIGASGSGKSTLADVVMGLLKPDAGVLRVDGRTVEGRDRLRWRRSVAYVPQEVFLFHDTVRNNLLWAAPDADDEALRRALERAAAEFVYRLPQGLDTQVGDGGVMLSGGERQRIALARALLHQPALLILDEATSALDRDNEERVRQAIEQLHGDLTVILIGHRLATLEHADQVVKMEQGRVAARGSWSEINGEAEHD